MRARWFRFAHASAARRHDDAIVEPCLWYARYLRYGPWMLCLLASCAAVGSPRSASRATFALKSAEYRLGFRQKIPFHQQLTDLRVPVNAGIARFCDD
jgi:hypothetical protein